MPKKRNDEIDNKWEFGAFLIKHWMKAVIIILAAGVAFTGFKVQCGKNIVQKDPIHFKNPMQPEVKNE